MPVQSLGSPSPNRSKTDSQSRRDFLSRALATGASIGLLPAWPKVLFGQVTEAPPATEKLIVRSEKPLNAEPALDQLIRDWMTPTESFYIRSHGEIPRLERGALRLSVEGLVDKPLTFAVAELMERFPALSSTVTLTCAGNRRNEFTGPKISGVSWGAGAIGNAEWSGVSLAALLKHAGIQAGAKHVWFEGTDEISDKNEKYPFGGSIPLEKALSDNERTPGALLATKMNGKPLTVEHGFPLRTVVPGYIGARSVKWLRKIVVSDRPSPNHYQAIAYKVITDDKPATIESAPPIYDFALNSAIGIPSTETAVAPGPLKVRGYALPGGAAGRSIAKVELSTDGGKNWILAKTVSPVRDFCWTLWAADVDVTNTTERLLVRATDSSGEVQPREMPWNMKGYQYNAWHQVALKRS